MKIRIEIDVPEYVNGTQCHECPFKNKDKICSIVGRKICDKVDFSRIRVKELLSHEELRKFANQYSHNIWEQLMQRFKADDKFYIGANDVSDYVLNAILDTYQKMMEEENE